MDFTALLYSFGLSGFFSSRAFLPAFATAFALKYGDKIPFLKSIEFIQAAGETPMWFTSGWVVWGLGILAVAELVAERSPELREAMEEGAVYVKSALAALTSFGLLSATDAKVVDDLLSHAGFLDTFPAAFSAAATYVMTKARDMVFGMLGEADDDDSLGLRSFVSWCEELWALFGVWLLLLNPPVMAVAIGLVFGVLWLIGKRHERQQEAAKIECPSCRSRIHTFATACYSCGWEQKAPRKLGFLGRTSEETQTDLQEQKLRLLELKRSPKSGERVKGRSVKLICEADQTRLFGDPALNRRYVEYVDARLPHVLLVGALFSLIPAIGLIIGVVYYRLRLVAPYRRYLGFRRGFFIRWLILLFFFVLVILQLVPILGGFVVPLMALINHRFYRSAFIKALREEGLGISDV